MSSYMLALLNNLLNSAYTSQDSYSKIMVSQLLIPYLDIEDSMSGGVVCSPGIWIWAEAQNWDGCIYVDTLYRDTHLTATPSDQSDEKSHPHQPQLSSPAIAPEQCGAFRQACWYPSSQGRASWYGVMIHLNRSLLTDLPCYVPGCQPATITGHRLRVNISCIRKPSGPNWGRTKLYKRALKWWTR